MIAPVGGYTVSRYLRDAEMLGILRHARAIVGCPACASDVRLDLHTGRIHCHRCHTTTDLRAYADGRADALMRTVPRISTPDSLNAVEDEVEGAPPYA